ncbi:MAG: MerR family transcriptional regulator [Bacillota bacterium]
MNKKNNYSTSEAAKLLGVAPSTLRYWESELGNSLRIKRNENGYRQYSSKDINLLKKIKKFLYEQKYSIKQVRELLNLEENKQELAALIVKKDDKNLSILLSKLIDKLNEIEGGIEELKTGHQNLKAEYLQTVNFLEITAKRRDKKLIKEIRKRMDENKNENKNIFQKLLPWKG